MSINLSALQNRQPKLDSIQYFKSYSVFAPLIATEDGYQLLFEVRSDKLKSQPNEICFPGGRIEPNETKEAACIRETCEELKIASENIHVLGELDTIITPFNLVIYPFIGYLKEYNFTYDSDEVKEIFTVPLQWFLSTKPSQYSIHVEVKPDSGFPFHMIQKGKNYPWMKGTYPVYFYEYENRIIWGITARMVKNICDIIM